MTRTTLLVLAAGWAIAAAVTVGASGCTADGWGKMYRLTRYPERYDDMPLGRDFSTRPQVARLKDEKLRNYMNGWLDLREEYLKVWREQGDDAHEVKRIQGRRSLMTTVIQDYVRQLLAAGQPLTD